jgi:hypothetical protein
MSDETKRDTIPLDSDNESIECIIHEPLLNEHEKQNCSINCCFYLFEFFSIFCCSS